MTCGTCDAGEDCAWDGCTADAHTRGFCEPHYRRRLHTGRYGYRDATEAREHLLRLRQLGWTYQALADTAGVSTWVPHKLVTGRQHRVLHESETAILAIPLVPLASYRAVNPVGTFRRVEALQWLGWPKAYIGQRVGLKPYTLTTLKCRGEQVSYRVALAVKALYEELSHLTGPSKQTATKARRSGYAPPAAWDDDTIDDPKVRPHGVRQECAA